MNDEPAIHDLAQAELFRRRVRVALLRRVPEAWRETAAGQSLSGRGSGSDSEPALAEAAMLRLADALALAPVETLAAALALWAEADAAVGAVLGLLQGDGARHGPRRPTVGLVASLSVELDPGDSLAARLAALMNGPAAALGLWREIGPDDAIAHERTLALAPPLLGALLAGELPANTAFGGFHAQRLPDAPWPLPRGWAEAAARLAADALCAPGSVVVLRGAEPADLRPFAAAVARQRGWQPVEITVPAAVADLAGASGLVPWLRLTVAAPLWAITPAPGERFTLPTWPAATGAPLFVLAPAQSSVHAGEALLLEFELPSLTPDDRVELWRALTAAPRFSPSPDSSPTRTCSAHSGLQAGVASRDRRMRLESPATPPALSRPREREPNALDRVRESRCGAAALARAALAAAAGQAPAAALTQMLRSGARDLSAWAQVAATSVPDNALVGPPALHRQLDLLREHCIARDRLGAALGPLLTGRLAGGVKALFVGASGTGKTLAAQWLAVRLGLPLARIDIASVVSKYIGETEKNLAQMLARAEHLDAVLLFDEADSLFGARTDVRQANDRYANMQTNYLLQRLESFRGIALLTSNSKARFDDAFMRRLDAVIEFPLPDAAERLRLWSLHLGASHALPPSQLQALAALVDLPGGHIRNAVLDAALRARLDGAPGAAIGCAQLLPAVVQQYAKLGRRAPDGLAAGLASLTEHGAGAGP